MFRRAFNASVERHITKDFIKAVKRDDTAAAHLLLITDMVDVNYRKDITSVFTSARADTSPIRIAIDNDSRPMLELLVKHGADINQQMIDGFYQLHPFQYAAEHAKTNCLKFLLDHPDTDLDKPLIMDDDGPFLEPPFIQGLEKYANTGSLPSASAHLLHEKLTEIAESKKAAAYDATAFKKLKR